MKNQAARHIITNATTTPVASTCYVSQLTISCSNAGTAWTIKIQDKAGTPKILVPALTLALPATPGPIIIKFDQPELMEGGIDIITAGTAPGVVDVWTHFEQST